MFRHILLFVLLCAFFFFFSLLPPRSVLHLRSILINNMPVHVIQTYIVSALGFGLLLSGPLFCLILMYGGGDDMGDVRVMCARCFFF
ncbi:uncharacterized protein P884DRAFT_255782 [Thermothelomyces heterothallicus CBS 202.75]|uniref:uncharacterized protein n=1 Tax=Thermothelomyces heterothallicus CBS 202.75 TaxID=1149848 RepID=UPI00374238EE